MKIDMVDMNGEKAGSVTADGSVWNAEDNIPLLHQVVTAQLANKRQGTHSTQRRAETSYSGRKLRQQKQSGRARLGARTSPSMVGGAVAHGPHPRSYRQVIPRKMRRGALRVALSLKRRDKQVTVVKEFEVPDKSSGTVKNMLKALNLQRKVLIVTAVHDMLANRSTSNFANVTIIPAGMLNPLATLNANHIVLTRDAVKTIDKLWGVKESAEDKQ